MKNKLFYGMVPAILFIFLEELLQAGMECLWQQAGVYGSICEHGTGLWNSFLSVLQGIEPGKRQALTVAVAMLGALPWIFRSLQGSIRSWEGISTKGKGNAHRRAADGACWMLISICLALGVNILMLLLMGSKVSSNGAEGGVSSADILLEAVVYGVVSPFAEEAVFRGSLFGNLRRCIPLWQAVLLSSLVFGIYHGNPMQTFYAFVMGMAFAAAYARCGQFAVPFVLHAVVNLAVLLFSYLGVTAKLANPQWCITFLALAFAGIFYQYSDKIHMISK